MRKQLKRDKRRGFAAEEAEDEVEAASVAGQGGLFDAAALVASVAAEPYSFDEAFANREGAGGSEEELDL